MEKKASSGSRKLKDGRTVTTNTEHRATDTHKPIPAQTAGKKRKKTKKTSEDDTMTTVRGVAAFHNHHKKSIASKIQFKGKFAAQRTVSAPPLCVFVMTYRQQFGSL